MSHQYRVRNHEEIHFITFTIVDWIDVFIRPSYKQLIIDSLIYCQKSKGLEIYAFCLMTNHLHLLVSARSPVRLPDIVRDFKKHTNKQIIKLIEAENESRRDWMCIVLSIMPGLMIGYKIIKCGGMAIIQLSVTGKTYFFKNWITFMIIPYGQK